MKRSDGASSASLAEAAPSAAATSGDRWTDQRTADRVRLFVAKFGVLIAVVVTIGAFSALKPHIFLTVQNAQSVLSLAAPLAIAALGLTVVLVMGEFDLSFGSMIGLGGAAAIVLMNNHHVAWPIAIVVALAIGLCAGSVNGLLTAYGGASPFIITLGMGTILTGLEYALTGEQTIYGHLPRAYISLGQSVPFLGINAGVWIAIGVAAVIYVLLERTEVGRYMYATGGNAEAARLSGLAVRRLRLTGFVIVGITAAIAGIVITATSAASYPDIGATYLLPSFAAAFLGSTILRNGQFNALGTVIGVLYLGVISTGLTMFQLSTAVVNIVQGAILIISILLSRLGRQTST